MLKDRRHNDHHCWVGTAEGRHGGRRGIRAARRGQRAVRHEGRRADKECEHRDRRYQILALFWSKRAPVATRCSGTLEFCNRGVKRTLVRMYCRARGHSMYSTDTTNSAASSAQAKSSRSAHTLPRLFPCLHTSDITRRVLRPVPWPHHAGLRHVAV